MTKVYVFGKDDGYVLEKNIEGTFDLTVLVGVTYDPEAKNLEGSWTRVKDQEFEADSLGQNQRDQLLRDGYCIEKTTIRATEVYTFHIPARSREKKDENGKLERYMLLGLTYHPLGKNLPKASWEYIGVGAISDDHPGKEGLERDGYFVGETPEPGSSPLVEEMHIFCITKHENNNGKVFRHSRIGYTVDILGNNLPPGEWKYLGGEKLDEDALVRAVVMRDLATNGFHIMEKTDELNPDWQAKWYMFRDKDKERRYRKDDKWMLMYFWGTTTDPDGKNLPAGNWKFVMPLDVNSLMVSETTELYKGIAEKGWHTEWIEGEDKEGQYWRSQPTAGRVTERTRSGKIVPNEIITTDEEVKSAVDRIYDRLSKK